MELFFSPMACALASRIVCYEVGTDAQFTQVSKAKRTHDGREARLGAGLVQDDAAGQ